MSDTAIRNVTHGDSFQVIRTVSNIPDGETVSMAWFTLKLLASRPDYQAAMQKTITTDDVIGTGAVVNSSPVGSVDLRFDISGTDWDDVVPGQLYLFDIQLKTTGGGLYTCDRGNFVADSSITGATT